jgi:hypothetical protein
MGFGLSFGSKKESGKSSTDVNKTETTDQTQTGTQSTTGSTSTTGTQNTQTSSSGTTTNNTSNQQATTGSQSSQQTSTQFSQPIISGLESTVQALLGNLPSSPSQMDNNFDHNAFVSGGTAAAASSINSDLESTLNGMFDNFGGRDDQNSMATLLANRARGDAASQIAGVRSNLEGQAQGIERERYLANLQGTGQQEGFLANVLNALKGGQATTSGQVQTAENTAGGTQATGTQAQTGTSNTQMSQQELTQQLTQLLQKLQGTTNTTGTEDTKTSGKTGGFGLGLSF